MNGRDENRGGGRGGWRCYALGKSCLWLTLRGGCLDLTELCMLMWTCHLDEVLVTTVSEESLDVKEE